MSGVVAIDGPSGAGKGTVARAVAAALAFDYVDTGAMYRAVAWRTLDTGGSLDDEHGVAEVARTASFELSSARVVIDGQDVTRAIRTPAMDKAAATVARMPRVREALVSRQREYAEDGNVVMEGRDIGTVVFSRCGRQDLSRCLTGGAGRAPFQGPGARGLEGDDPHRHRQRTTRA